jgi:hypothetical protein
MSFSYKYAKYTEKTKYVLFGGGDGKSDKSIIIKSRADMVVQREIALNQVAEYLDSERVPSSNLILELGNYNESGEKIKLMKKYILAKFISAGENFSTNNHAVVLDRDMTEREEINITIISIDMEYIDESKLNVTKRNIYQAWKNVEENNKNILTINKNLDGKNLRINYILLPMVLKLQQFDNENPFLRNLRPTYLSTILLRNYFTELINYADRDLQNDERLNYDDLFDVILRYENIFIFNDLYFNTNESGYFINEKYYYSSEPVNENPNLIELWRRYRFPDYTSSRFTIVHGTTNLFFDLMPYFMRLMLNLAYHKNINLLYLENDKIKSRKIDFMQ